jgi:hypothetical protein
MENSPNDSTSKDNLVSLAAKPHSLSNIIRLLAWGLGLLYVFSRFIPCQPITDFESFDNIWSQILHVAYAEHMQFGQDVVFTYGPWGFLASGYYPPTYLVSVTAWLALSLLFICAGWRVARHFTNNQVMAWLWLIAFTAMASLPGGNDIGGRLTAWGILLLALHFFVEKQDFSPLQACLAFTLGWLGLVKFTGFMEGAFLVMVITADNIVRHRRFPWIIPVWLAGIVIFWLLAGQRPGLLWTFLRNSWELANGYTDAMSLGNLRVLKPVIYLLIGAGFCVLGILLLRPPRRMSGVFLGLGLGGMLFLSFKQGYVRNDDIHETATMFTLLLIGLAWLAVAATRGKTMAILAASLVCVSTLFAACAARFENSGDGFFQELVLTFSPGNLFSPLASAFTNRLQTDYEKQIAVLKANRPLPAVQGGTDLYSFYQITLFANGLSYRPRPVIQSYSAYTPMLARMNADWLRTDRAAPTLFFAIQVIDNELPSQEDGLSWPELLTRYDIKGTDKLGMYLWMSRSPKPREYHLQPLQETTVTLGKPFVLPAATNGLIWAQIEINKTLVGDLLSFFYKPEILLADAKLADGSEQISRLIPGIVRTGFLLSPYIKDTPSFLALAKADEAVFSRKVVLEMTLRESGQSSSSFCYQPQVKIRFYRLDLPAQDVGF